MSLQGAENETIGSLGQEWIERSGPHSRGGPGFWTGRLTLLESGPHRGWSSKTEGSAICSGLLNQRN